MQDNKVLIDSLFTLKYCMVLIISVQVKKLFTLISNVSYDTRIPPGSSLWRSRVKSPTPYTRIITITSKLHAALVFH